MSKKRSEVIDWLCQLSTIREQAHRLLSLAKTHDLHHFNVHPEKLPSSAEFVLDVMKQNYPDLKVPYHSRWRHFEMAHSDPLKCITLNDEPLDDEEKGKRWFELAILSVILDAGAGKDWTYVDPRTQKSYQRSEGLALASLCLYADLAFSINSESLLSLSQADLSTAFQVREKNPLKGLQGRFNLLQKLGKLLTENPDVFPHQRLGDVYTFITQKHSDHIVTTDVLFNTIQSVLNPIWPARITLDGHPLGDVWQHPALKAQDVGSDYLPFHKLSQWLTYSLIEPLQWLGFVVKDMDHLTGLPEYRNGGLLIDTGVLEPNNQALLKTPQPVSSEAVIEWRGLTVALLDLLAEEVRRQAGMDANTLPLASILQGGTWEAGRQIAKTKRTEGTPPI